ncbi:MAG: endonuclease domain-containing protein [Solirubrobacteraceae bacterium]
MPGDELDDRPILRIADAQRGLIEHSQLLRNGFDRHAIRRRRERGWLRRKHQGVYVVGHAAPVPFMDETAAILAYGSDSFIAGRSSLVLWKITDERDDLPVVVTVVGRSVRRHEGTILHRVALLHPCDVGVCERLRVTMPARALLESASTLDLHELERAVDEALALGLIDRPALLAVIERYPGYRGAAILRELADPNRASEITASMAEKRFAVLLRKADAPPSRTQYPIGPYRVDRCWPELRLVVEIDSVQFHRDRKRMEADYKRADYLRFEGGYTVVRFTRGQVVYEPEYVLFRLGREFGPPAPLPGLTARLLPA